MKHIDFSISTAYLQSWYLYFNTKFSIYPKNGKSKPTQTGLVGQITWFLIQDLQFNILYKILTFKFLLLSEKRKGLSYMAPTSWWVFASPAYHIFSNWIDKGKTTVCISRQIDLIYMHLQLLTDTQSCLGTESDLVSIVSHPSFPMLWTSLTYSSLITILPRSKVNIQNCI